MNFLKRGQKLSGGTQNAAVNATFGGNVPVASFNGNGIHGSHGGILPPALLEENRVPKFYQDAIVTCGATSSQRLPSTAQVYSLMISSNLEREILGQIWSLVNRSLPGQLTRQEFFSCLALIALAQKGQSISALSTMKTLPIPHLSFSVSQNTGSSSGKTSSTSTVVASPTVRPSHKMSEMVPSTVKTLPMQYNVKPNAKSKADMGNSRFSEGSLISLSSSPTGKSTYSGLSRPASMEVSSHLADLATLDLTDAGATTTTTPNSSSPDTSLPDASASDGKASIDSQSPTPVVDIYAAFKEVSCNGTSQQESEEFTIWNKCVSEASTIMEDAHSRFAENPEVSKEVLSTERGSNYLCTLQEIFDVALRISQSAEKRGLKQLAIQKVSVSWKNVRKLTGFTPSATNTSVSNGHFDDKRCCGICLQAFCSENHSNVIEFIGRTYHAQCANFWINRIDSLLPQLSPS